MQGARYLSIFWEDFQVGRALSLSPDDCKHRPTGESLEPNSCCVVREICESGLECLDDQIQNTCILMDTSH